MASRLDLILTFVTPQLQVAAQLLRRRDTDSTGADDLTADILDFASRAISAIQNGLPLPDLPESLRPKPEEDLGTENPEIKLKE